MLTTVTLHSKVCGLFSTKTVGTRKTYMRTHQRIDICCFEGDTFSRISTPACYLGRVCVRRANAAAAASIGHNFHRRWSEAVATRGVNAAINPRARFQCASTTATISSQKRSNSASPRGPSNTRKALKFESAQTGSASSSSCFPRSSSATTRA